MRQCESLQKRNNLLLLIYAECFKHGQGFLVRNLTFFVSDMTYSTPILGSSSYVLAPSDIIALYLSFTIGK